MTHGWKMLSFSKEAHYKHYTHNYKHKQKGYRLQKKNIDYNNNNKIDAGKLCQIITLLQCTVQNKIYIV